MNRITLNNLPVGKSGKINELKCGGIIRRRMLDLGLVNGTIITPLFISPFGDPIAYEFRGSVIALRKDDSKLIFIDNI